MREAKRVDEVQIAVDLIGFIRCAAQFGGERGSPELLRFPGAERNPGQVTDIGRDMWRLAERAEDHRGVERTLGDQLDELVLTRGAERELPQVLPNRSPEEYGIEPPQER